MTNDRLLCVCARVMCVCVHCVCVSARARGVSWQRFEEVEDEVCV